MDIAAAKGVAWYLHSFFYTLYIHSVYSKLLQHSLGNGLLTGASCLPARLSAGLLLLMMLWVLCAPRDCCLSVSVDVGTCLPRAGPVLLPVALLKLLLLCWLLLRLDCPLLWLDLRF